VETTLFKRKPSYVQAVRVNQDNFLDVVAWCQGSIVTPGQTFSLDTLRDIKDKYISVRVANPARERQTKAYRDRVLPPSIRARVSIEAAVGLGWRDYVGDAGRVISLEHFGASADYKTLYREFGITPEATVKAAKDSIKAANAAATVAPVQDVNPRSAQNGSLTDTTPAKPAAKKATVAAR